MNRKICRGKTHFLAKSRDKQKAKMCALTKGNKLTKTGKSQEENLVKICVRATINSYKSR